MIIGLGDIYPNAVSIWFASTLMHYSLGSILKKKGEKGNLGHLEIFSLLERIDLEFYVLCYFIFTG